MIVTYNDFYEVERCLSIKGGFSIEDLLNFDIETVNELAQMGFITTETKNTYKLIKEN